jgi:hypothetical protein
MLVVPVLVVAGWRLCQRFSASAQVLAQRLPLPQSGFPLLV